MVVAVMVGAALTAFDAPASAAVGDKAIQDIDRYCQACWRNARLPADAWGDCTQEVFHRLLQRVPMHSWTQVLAADGEERREFVRAIDAVKKRTQRRKKFGTLNEEVSDHTFRPQQEITENRELVRRAAENVLSSRQQQIIQLSFEGYSVQDLAARLRMSPERVSDEKYKAIRKLRSHLGVDV